MQSICTNCYCLQPYPSNPYTGGHQYIFSSGEWIATIVLRKRRSLHRKNASCLTPYQTKFVWAAGKSPNKRRSAKADKHNDVEARAGRCIYCFTRLALGYRAQSLSLIAGSGCTCKNFNSARKHSRARYVHPCQCSRIVVCVEV